VDAVRPSTSLPYCEIGHPAHARSEPNSAPPRALDHDLVKIAITNDLHRLINDDPLPVQPRPNEYPVTRVGRSERILQARMIATVECVNN
jgi:hypothetical protein